jgi:hypothetical protein
VGDEVGGAQKPGDVYNYKVAAFLKTNIVDYSPSIFLDLQKYSFNAAPDDFPHNATLFDQKISIDLIVSTSTDEYLCECKSTDSAKNLSVNSPDFKEALLEFIGLEFYRRRQVRTVRYLLITNMSINNLEKEISTLKVNHEELLSYLLKLKAQAKKKWKNFEASIETRDVLTTLNNLLLLKIEKGRLLQAERTQEFQEQLMDIVRRVEKKNPHLVPIALLKKTTLRLDTSDGNEDFIERMKMGYYVEIHNEIIEQIMNFELSLNKNIVKATVNELPFLGKHHLRKKLNVSSDQAAQLITETINDIIEERLGDLTYITLFFPTHSEIFFAKTVWASKIVDQHYSPTKGKYLLMTSKELGCDIPPLILILLITETKRIVNGIVIDQIKISKN